MFHCMVQLSVCHFRLFSYVLLIHRFAVPLPRRGRLLIVDFRLLGFGEMLRYTVGRGLAPAAKKRNKFHFYFGFDDLH